MLAIKSKGIKMKMFQILSHSAGGFIFLDAGSKHLLIDVIFDIPFLRL